MEELVLCQKWIRTTVRNTGTVTRGFYMGVLCMKTRSQLKAIQKSVRVSNGPFLGPIHSYSKFDVSVEFSLCLLF